MAINEVTSIDVKTLPPFKRLIMTLGELPTSYLESMTYAELLMWFCNFLQEKVLPTINNNADALQEVITYLKNLDLQDEVNNKLDEMVEDGTFESILLNYTKTNRLYNTYEELIEDKNALVNDEKIKTLGYYEINDQGGCEYLVTNQEPETFNIDLENGLYLIPIIKNNSINIRQLGAKETQATDTKALQTFALSNIKTLIISDGSYKLNDIVDFTNKELIGIGKPKISINGITTSREHTIHIGGSCNIKNIEFDLDIGSTNILGLYNAYNCIIENCKFKVNNVSCNGYVDVYTNNQNIRFENCDFTCSSLNNDETNHGGGLWVREMTAGQTTNDIYFNNCLFYHRSSDETVACWKANGTLKNVQLNNCKFEANPLNTAQHFIRFDCDNSSINNSILIYKPSDNNNRSSIIKNDNNYYVTINNCYIDISTILNNGLLYGNKIIANNCEIHNNKRTNIGLPLYNDCQFKLLELQTNGINVNNCTFDIDQKTAWCFSYTITINNSRFNFTSITDADLVLLFDNNRKVKITNNVFTSPADTNLRIGNFGSKTGTELIFNNNILYNLNANNTSGTTGYITNNVCSSLTTEVSTLKYNNNFNINA